MLSGLQFPPLDVEFAFDAAAGAMLSEEGIEVRAQADCIAEFVWEGKNYRFIVEIKSKSTPKTIDAAVAQLRYVTDRLRARNAAYGNIRLRPMVVAPYLAEEALGKLVAAEMSGIDFCGNGVINVPGKIFVYRSGAKNKFPSSDPIKNVFRGVSSIVCRTLFTRPVFSSATELLAEIEARGGATTIATVSKVLKSLEEELLISKADGIRLIDAPGLLARLRDNYRAPEAPRRFRGNTANMHESLVRIIGASREGGFKAAADEPEAYAVIPSSSPVARIYTNDIDECITAGDLTEDDRYPNIELIETADPALYFDLRSNIEAEGDTAAYLRTSPMQVYLELSAGGKREKEIAKQIEDSILAFTA